MFKLLCVSPQVILSPLYILTQTIRHSLYYYCIIVLFSFCHLKISCTISVLCLPLISRYRDNFCIAVLIQEIYIYIYVRMYTEKFEKYVKYTRGKLNTILPVQRTMLEFKLCSGVVVFRYGFSLCCSYVLLYARQ